MNNRPAKIRILSLPTLLFFKNEEHPQDNGVLSEELIKVLEENVLNDLSLLIIFSIKNFCDRGIIYMSYTDVVFKNMCRDIWKMDGGY